MTHGMKWFNWFGVVMLSTLALWTPRAEAMPPVAWALVAGVAAVTAAEPARAATPPTAGQQADKALSRAMNGIQAAGARMAGSLWSEGITLFWAVWTLMFGWTVYKNYHLSEDLVGSLSLFGATSMFIYLVMMLYMPPRGGVGTWGGSPVYMAQIFTSGFEDYAKKIAGSSGIAGMGVKWDSMQAVGVKLFWNSITQLQNFAVGAHLVPDSPGWTDYIVAIGRGLLRFPHVLLALIASLIVGLAMVVYLFVILMADVLVAVGLTLGPIMIPFYLMPVLSFLFDGWLRFMITAGFFKLVATIMLAMTYNLVKELEVASISINQSATGWNAASAAAAANTWTGDLMSLSLAIVIAVITLLMMWQVPGIAGALSGGSTGGDMKQAVRTLSTIAKAIGAGKK